VNWLFLTLLSVLIASLANIFQKVLMKDNKSDPYSYAVIFHFLIGFLDLIFAVLRGFQFPLFNQNLLFFLLAAILWGSGTIFLFRALQHLESSQVTILGSTKVLVTIVTAIIFLHESFNLQKLIGTIIIIIAIVLVSGFKKGMKFNNGMIYIFGMALCYGIALVVDTGIVKHYDPISYLAVSNILIGTLLLIRFPKVIKQARSFFKLNFLKKMLPVGILSSSQAMAYYSALSSGQASQIASINQSQVIVTILLAVILLKERSNLLLKLIAAVLTTIGVILLKDI
jgi:uncharacterized membrane protein